MTKIINFPYWILYLKECRIDARNHIVQEQRRIESSETFACIMQPDVEMAFKPEWFICK